MDSKMAGGIRCKQGQSDACCHKRNLSFKYRFKGSELVVNDQELDLGVIVDSLLKMLTQCVAAAKMSDSVLNIMTKGIDNKTADIIMLL